MLVKIVTDDLTIIKLFGLTLYKREIKNFYVIKTFFLFFKFKSFLHKEFTQEVFTNCYKQVSAHFDNKIKELSTQINLARLESKMHSNFCELTLLANKYGSDKGSLDLLDSFDINAFDEYPHTYTEVYGKMFSSIRFEVKNLFVFGIGINYLDVINQMIAMEVPGASLRMWRDYFPFAQIYGADVDSDLLFEENRIQTECIDQTDPKNIINYFTVLNKSFDIMIDDGLHSVETVITLFENAIKFLADSGTYVIEDMNREELQEIYNYFADKNNKYVVQYVIMEVTDICPNNNLVIIKKKI